MNNINFEQTGGFPLETDTLNFMQSTYNGLQALAALAGDNYILSGCTVTASSVSDGYVVLNGELLPFRGGLLQTNITIREEKQTRPFENGQTKEVFVIRYVSFGTGTAAIPFMSLLRLKPLSLFRNLPNQSSSAINIDDDNTLATSKAVKNLNDKINAQLPTGAIVIWSGGINAIPAGWALCDGNGGRPNLLDRFVLGAGNKYPVGGIGGAETHTLRVEEMPSHDHPYTATVGGTDFGKGSTRDSNTNTFEARTGRMGGNQSHNNMPPYFALAYIIKL